MPSYSLYPKIAPYKTEYLEVSDLHTIYLEQSGNPEGTPAVFLHGGPGGATSPTNRRFFNPQKYRIILFDQRGCGKSRPLAELRENTTSDLISDLEKIRAHLNIHQWILFGGSWGSALSMAYSLKCPDRVLALVLRGIFLCSKRELDWLYKKGASNIYPEEWTELKRALSHCGTDNILEKAFKILNGSDIVNSNKASIGICKWGASLATMQKDKEIIHKYSQISYADTLARIKCHYFLNGGFFDSDSYLLDNVGSLNHIPIKIIHGRYDMISPVESAYFLKEAASDAKLTIVPNAGHSLSEPGIISELVKTMDEMAV